MSVGVATEDTAGVVTSVILSAISADLSRLEVLGVEARTIPMLAGSLCKKSSLKKELSAVSAWSPNSCCILVGGDQSLKAWKLLVEEGHQWAHLFLQRLGQPALPPSYLRLVRVKDRVFFL